MAKKFNPNKAPKTKEFIRMLEDNGFQYIRNNGHMIYRKGERFVSIPNHKGVMDKGLYRKLMKQAGLLENNVWYQEGAKVMR